VVEGLVDARGGPKSGSVGGSGRLAVNFPLGETAAVRWSCTSTTCGLHRFHSTGRAASRRDVNDGDRAGMRLSMLWKPTDQLSITPRIVFQNLSTNGYPREDALTFSVIRT